MSGRVENPFGAALYGQGSSSAVSTSSAGTVSSSSSSSVPIPTSDSAFTRSTGISLKDVQIIVCVETSKEMGEKVKFPEGKMTRMAHVVEKVKPLFSELVTADPNGVDLFLFDDDARLKRVRTGNEALNILEEVKTTSDKANIASVVKEAWIKHERSYCQDSQTHKLTVAVVITAGKTSSGTMFKSGKRELQEEILRIANRVSNQSEPQFRIVFAPVAEEKSSANFISELDNLKGAKKDIVSQINMEGTFDRESILNKAWYS